MRSLNIIVPAILLTACDFATYPGVATYDGSGAASLDVVVRANTMPSDAVQAVELTLTEVALHRTFDDTWVIVGPERLTVEFEQPTTRMAIDAAPIDRETYDTLQLTLGRVRIAQDDVWRVATVTDTEIDLALTLEPTSGSAVEVIMNLDESLRHDPEKGWTFIPAAELGDMDLNATEID